MSLVVVVVVGEVGSVCACVHVCVWGGRVGRTILGPIHIHFKIVSILTKGIFRYNFVASPWYL